MQRLQHVPVAAERDDHVGVFEPRVAVTRDQFAACGLGFVMRARDEGDLVVACVGVGRDVTGELRWTRRFSSIRPILRLSRRRSPPKGWWKRDLPFALISYPK